MTNGLTISLVFRCWNRAVALVLDQTSHGCHAHCSAGRRGFLHTLIKKLLTSSQGSDMGYAGYAPGKYAPPKPTEVQAALRQVARQDSYELLSKLLRNVVRPPLQGRLSDGQCHRSQQRRTRIRVWHRAQRLTCTGMLHRAESAARVSACTV